MAHSDDRVAHHRVCLHLVVHTTPETRSLLLPFLTEAIPFYEASGDLKVRLLQDMSDPDAFIEIIEYDSLQAFERDNKRTESDPQMVQYLTRWRKLLSGVEVRTYHDITPSIPG